MIESRPKQRIRWRAPRTGWVRRQHGHAMAARLDGIMARAGSVIINVIICTI